MSYDRAKFITRGVKEKPWCAANALTQVEPEGRDLLEKMLKYFGIDIYRWMRDKFPYEDFYERLVLKELPIYGSDRLGMNAVDTTIKAKRIKGQVSGGVFSVDSVLYMDSLVMDEMRYARITGKKRYELKDHLGNVRVVISDKKTSVNQTVADTCVVTYYEPTIVAANDYFPFGSISRSWDTMDLSIPGMDTCIAKDTMYGILDDYVTANGASALINTVSLGVYINNELKSVNTAEATVEMLKDRKYLMDTLDFNGSGYIDFGKQNQYKFGTGDFSIECWFFLPSGLAGGNYTIISNAKFDGIETYEGGFELTLNTNNNAINFTLNDGSGTWNNSKGTARCFITTGKWYHLVVNRTGNDVNNWKIYLNGVSQTVTVNQNNLTTGDISAGTDENLKIGTRLNGHPSAQGYMNGTIREVRLYNRLLGSTEISDNYNDSCNSFPSDTTGLVLWSKLDKGSGTSETDYSRFSETGTFTGTGLSWGRKIREDGCTDASTCFEQVSARYFAGGQLRGFNGMMRDDEIAGSGNSYTAEFWQYDPRTGRRWNLDPVIAPWESPYAAFRNNPVYFIDPFGDSPQATNDEEGDPPTVKKDEQKPTGSGTEKDPIYSKGDIRNQTIEFPEMEYCLMCNESGNETASDNTTFNSHQINARINLLFDPAYQSKKAEENFWLSIQYGSSDYVGSLMRTSSPLDMELKLEIMKFRVQTSYDRFSRHPIGGAFMTFVYGGISFGPTLYLMNSGFWGNVIANNTYVGSGSNRMLLAHTFRHGEAKLGFSFGRQLYKYGGTRLTFLTDEQLLSTPLIYNRLGFGFIPMQGSYNIYGINYSGLYLRGIIGKQGTTLGGANQFFNIGGKGTIRLLGKSSMFY